MRGICINSSYNKNELLNDNIYRVDSYEDNQVNNIVKKILK